MTMYSGSDMSMDQNGMFYKQGGGYVSVKRAIILVVVFLILGLAIGLLIGALVIGDATSDDCDGGVFISGASPLLMKDGDEDVWPLIRDGIDAKNIEENLRLLSAKPHIAGRKNDADLVNMIKTRWESDGLQVQTTPYDVLLSYPNNTRPNAVRLLDENGDVTYDSTSDLSNITNEPDVVAPFLAYSPNGVVTAEPVFVAYGRVEDYDILEKSGIDVTGRIVIVKYGKLFRGDKVQIAESKGAVGAILYTDPQEYTGLMMGDNRVYPETWWLPGTGAQRGTIFTGSGDPLTPGFAATNLGYRYTVDAVEPPMPKIPAQQIGYNAAVKILKHMGGALTPTDGDWQGGMNITYRLGPGFQNAAWRLQLDVTNRDTRVTAENVFGIIKGSIEPDRYVMMGNHRDAWIYGAVDPSSGTAVMLEVSRVMASLVRQGKWKPRRSIMFCSWGAEEYGLIGSTEWVEQYVSTLRERGVAYVNVDIAVKGNDTLSVGGTPVLHSLTYDAAKKVSNPNEDEIKAGRSSIYDTWLKKSPLTDEHGNSVPIIVKPASGSDYAPIVQMAGIDAIDISYTYDKDIYKVPSYAIYHTEYETFRVVKEQFDRDFKYHQAVGRLASEVVRQLSDSLVLPFNLTTYGEHMALYKQILDADYGVGLRTYLDNYDVFDTVIANFSKDIAAFEESRTSIEMSNPFLIRQVNDQLMLLEKCFLSAEGLPTRPYKKHLIFAENANDAYAGSSFPGIVDLLFEIDKHPDRWEDVKKHFSTVIQTIQSAGASLRDVTKFMSETL